MTNNIHKSFEQAASFQKIWLDSVTNMAGVFSHFSPTTPPPEQAREIRSSMLKVLSDTWNDFMRSPQFMEVMKLSLNGAFDMRSLMRDGMNKIHEQLETPTKEDVEGILLAIRHVERRLLERLEGMEERTWDLNDSLERIEEQIEAIEERKDDSSHRSESATNSQRRSERRDRSPIRRSQSSVKSKRSSRK